MRSRVCPCLAQKKLTEAYCQPPKPLKASVKLCTVNAVDGTDDEAVDLLDFARKIAGEREAAMQDGLGGTCIDYVRHLHKDALDKENRYKAEFQWISRITKRKGELKCKLTTFLQELKMSSVYHALSGRIDALKQLEHASDDDAGGEISTRVVRILRESAGLALESSLVGQDPESSAAPRPASYASLPCELNPSMTRSLHKAMLGEAQLVTAHRAEVKGSSSSLVSALYSGGRRYFQEAKWAIKGNIGEFEEVNHQMVAYLTLMARLCSARSFEHSARQFAQQEQIAEAISAMRQAVAKVDKCAPLADEHRGWKDVFKEERARLTVELGRLDKENNVVYFQKQVSSPSKCAAPKQIVKEIQFSYAGE